MLDIIRIELMLKNKRKLRLGNVSKAFAKHLEIHHQERMFDPNITSDTLDLLYSVEL